LTCDIGKWCIGGGAAWSQSAERRTGKLRSPEKVSTRRQPRDAACGESKEKAPPPTSGPPPPSPPVLKALPPPLPPPATMPPLSPVPSQPPSTPSPPASNPWPLPPPPSPPEASICGAQSNETTSGSSGRTRRDSKVSNAEKSRHAPAAASSLAVFALCPAAACSLTIFAVCPAAACCLTVFAACPAAARSLTVFSVCPATACSRAVFALCPRVIAFAAATPNSMTAASARRCSPEKQREREFKVSSGR